ncbi:MAG: hypothetical protein JNM80_11650 [Phycisphaerae bacterium]|nr:hypothetical protein [Phycisphaerae bacterium]
MGELERRCLRCRYDLRGIAPGSTCPECGTRADDPGSLLNARVRVVRGLRRLESGLLLPLAILVCAALLVLIATALMM